MDRSLYFNYKKIFSIVLLALVDAHYNFIAVDIGSYGKDSDGGIFSKSNLGKAFENKTINVPDGISLPSTNEKMPYVIVADEAFPLKPYLLRPYPGNQISGDNSKYNFNYRLSRARRVSENAFGILSQKFRIYNRRLNLHPENADRIVLSTCVLHNYIKKTGIDYEQNEVEFTTSTNLSSIPRQGGNAVETSFQIRDKFRSIYSSSSSSS